MTPPLVRLILRVLLPEEEREFLLGDLEESRSREGGREGRRHSWAREILSAVALRYSGVHRRGSRGGEKKPSKGDGMFQELLHDLRFGLRMVVRSPAFAVVALVTMALGIGANTAMFSVVHGVLLKPLPYPEADRIVWIRESNVSRGWDRFSISPLNYWDWEERNRSLELLASYRSTSVTLTGRDRPETLSGYAVSQDFLKILGGEPVMGRGITQEDMIPDAAPVVVVSHGLWQTGFGGDPDILETTMVLDGVARTVVGVTPRDWKPLSRAPRDVILPLVPQTYWYQARGSHFLSAVARIKDDVTLERAADDLASIASTLEAEYPESNTGWSTVVLPLGDFLLGESGPQLIILLASVGLVLLIACANVANMTLARSTARARELAIRTAVGAGRGRVIRQLLAESTGLALMGGAMGTALAYFSLEAFKTGWPTMLPRMEEIEVSGTVLLFSLGVSMVSGGG